MRKYFIAVLFLSLLGCAATKARSRLERMPGSASGNPYAPLNEAQTTGVVSYKLGTNGSSNAECRNDAYKKMFDVCKGHYRIVREHDDAAGYAETFTGAVVKLRRQNIEFQCVEAGDEGPGTTLPAGLE